MREDLRVHFDHIEKVMKARKNKNLLPKRTKKRTPLKVFLYKILPIPDYKVKFVIERNGKNPKVNRFCFKFFADIYEFISLKHFKKTKYKRIEN